MNEYVMERIEELEVFCSQNQISVGKVLKSPKSYNKEVMFILHHDPELGKFGLMNETPAKTLLTIRKKTNGGLAFYPESDIREYLS